jgi:hypothetical protein
LSKVFAKDGRFYEIRRYLRMVKDILGELRRGYGIDRRGEDKKGNHDQEYVKNGSKVQFPDDKEDKFL